MPFAISGLLIATQSFAQAPRTPHEVTAIDSIPGVGSTELYRRAQVWFIDHYKSASNVIQHSDSSEKVIIGKARFEFVPIVKRGRDVRTGTIQYTIEVSCKDGRYRLRMYDYSHEGSKVWNDFYKSMVGPDNLGQLFDGEPCFALNPGVEYGKTQQEICEKEVVPQLIIHDSSLRQSLHKAMSTASPSKSDW